ncbi:helix-turn-helix domain-containing protein [Rhizobium halophytocola]|uniref:Y4mF family transcriptional regulator n=1 Tax=Rhizobium halophytocola TaxID=735519 RepID=A0ABS4DVG4_9HYPH|nr:helix-turn-helix domain-containing protein [Rhizobium halophytocola]MBP1849678.1 y4mF family transcriptional regulator [Rhizobium halophytocola]
MIRTAAEFGQSIRKKRKALGWTQNQLAERCGTGERFIVELEAGKPSCQLEKALIAARVVGLDLVDRHEIVAAPAAGDDDLAHLPRF